MTHSNQELNQSQLPQNPVQWSESKYREMIGQLIGYWQQDVWHSRENPLKDNKSFNPGISLCFENCPEFIKTEIKFVCYQKATTQEWSTLTLHTYASYINRICKWLSERNSSFKSLIEQDLNEWLLSLRTYLVGEKQYFKGQFKQITGNGKIELREREDKCIYIFTQIYKTILDLFDHRNEYEKDVWDLRKLGFTNTYVNTSRQHILDFTEIKFIWLRQATKKFIKYKLTLVSSSCCHHKLLAIEKFSQFLFNNYSEIQSNEINRNLILEYLSYIANLEIGSSYRHKMIAGLREFLQLCFREEWLNVTGNQVIYDDDLPKYKRNYNPDYIPEEVIQKILQDLDEVKNIVYRRMFLILIECGMRISELCHIRFDCLKQNNQGDYFLLYHQFKMKKDISIPVSQEVKSIIQAQQEDVKKNQGDNCPYLFPSNHYKNKLKAISARPFCNSLKKLIYEKDIRDINGQLWNFHSHQCRHTVGTRMINNGVPQHIIQRYLGHESPTMTQVYAHIHDETLRKEVEKYHESRVVNFQGEVAELDETVLSSNDDLEWFKKNVQARALEHGYCARPKVLGDCNIPGFDGCYNCPHWRTNKNFLPILKDTLERTNSILQKAQNLGWQLQINKNIPVKDNLEKVIQALESDETP
ncbi:MAG: phage integrase family protein [Stigonema ocellatum SAG 48.90 = DSM 106950]|nr:phage integrase family protein [Stigonema ocellatum SAG 48.90 = DSM 106950]